MPLMKHHVADTGMHEIHWIDPQWDRDLALVKSEFQKVTMAWLAEHGAAWSNTTHMSFVDAGQVLLKRTYGEWLTEHGGAIGMGASGGWHFSVTNTTHGIQFMVRFSDKNLALLFKLTHSGASPA